VGFFSESLRGFGLMAKSSGEDFDKFCSWESYELLKFRSVSHGLMFISLVLNWIEFELFDG
jgi:hypothetical protein